MKSCDVEGCLRDCYGRKYCSMHYMRIRRNGYAGPVEPYRVAAGALQTRRGYKLVSIQGRRYFVHRLVMEQRLGRPLTDQGTVHHIDGNRANNDPSNLELWVRSQPPGVRVADQVAWARSILATYGGLPESVLSPQGGSRRSENRELPETARYRAPQSLDKPAS